mmetsp:Transcript_38505/g.50479  ORF Transcript_38505/g.50479 Transcript_38505/m.50479 type:complete len:106 (-) Transcript_38505:164-481(-)|eukprot:CAMPEP_0185598156 /NCGR_PEP_ID=MMETSP0434-20130131/81824_1 /TAXON_ID=626734 ORGANISM="Favella taraikaensis, Strain Fe Narragansett Bay" /NCGR_SAMPLE_ID=MMETSP0434 /ASSEMBLY_ACC=CAM_ASM_000379 /LENGTH=105 /DNA_ID=CAMNT_0028227079 /DNA_START=3002 /DNA_END=3319 /DNA_ORIENTATION=-
MVSNFQYLATCIAFSVGEPFRRAWWTNGPFLVSVVLILIANVAFVLLPDHSAFASFFGLMPFEAHDGTSYYSYRYLIVVGIIANSALTYAAEKFIALTLTRKWEA